jgi:uncharacterized protein (DUF305 family)
MPAAQRRLVGRVPYERPVPASPAEKTVLQRYTGIVALLAVVSASVGCGTDDVAPRPVTHTAAGGETYNDADVEFASDMIQHHAQALAMVDLTIDRRLDPAINQLAEDVRMAHGQEIEQMTDWLQDWDRPIPETVRDHANAHGDAGTETGSDLPGMMSVEQLAALEASDGAEFEDAWIQLMIEHHQGAIELARTQQSDGEHPGAVELAKSIETAQLEEVSTMEVLLGA